jgi:hypothetical protein
MAGFFLLCNSLPDFPLALVQFWFEKDSGLPDSPAASATPAIQLNATRASYGIVHSKTEVGEILDGEIRKYI